MNHQNLNNKLASQLVGICGFEKSQSRPGEKKKTPQGHYAIHHNAYSVLDSLKQTKEAMS